MDILRPGYQRVEGMPAGEILPALEKQAVLVSLENLMTFPFVKAAVEDDRLTLHGLWTIPARASWSNTTPPAKALSAFKRVSL